MASYARELVSLPYSREALHKIWAYACHRDILDGGHWDATVASLTRWTRPFRPTQEGECPARVAVFHVAWGAKPRLWAVERPAHARPEVPWLALGEIERAALGELVHGMAPTGGAEG